ncbi:glutamate racemase|nr:glutamate racemase [Noviherbaspirillum sp. L7-7A]MBV0879414.1 glutamate racemase [Noviherbaspirillum sp. L7-7A]
MPTAVHAPVGIFDSGLGGLSVLRHVRRLLPHEALIYAADSAFAPYGGKDEAAVLARTVAMADFLVAQGVKALVIACNTATAGAIVEIRRRYPTLPVVGVEPGLKPAALQTRTGMVGVLATERTLASRRFLALEAQIAESSGVRFIGQPCPGLADQVEKGELRSPATMELVRRFVGPLIAAGADALVLGCTHYPFLVAQIESAAREAGAASLAIIDTGDAVARQLGKVLAEQGLLSPPLPTPASIAAWTTGSASSLSTAMRKLLHLTIAAKRIAERPD